MGFCRIHFERVYSNQRLCSSHVHVLWHGGCVAGFSSGRTAYGTCNRTRLIWFSKRRKRCIIYKKQGITMTKTEYKEDKSWIKR